MIRIAAILSLCALALAPTAASASQQGSIVIKKWKSMDQCSKEAQAAFPDFTAQSNALREAKLKECLAGGNLPPREPLTPAH